jgi:hypothetical protein
MRSRSDVRGPSTDMARAEIRTRLSGERNPRSGGGGHAGREKVLGTSSRRAGLSGASVARKTQAGYFCFAEGAGFTGFSGVPGVLDGSPVMGAAPVAVTAGDWVCTAAPDAPYHVLTPRCPAHASDLLAALE